MPIRRAARKSACQIPAATEELEREALAKMPRPVVGIDAAEKSRYSVPQPSNGRPDRAAPYLFWIVIALSVGAIVATIAAR